jgi:hypothetical protein
MLEHAFKVTRRGCEMGGPFAFLYGSKLGFTVRLAFMENYPSDKNVPSRYIDPAFRYPDFADDDDEE